MFSWLFQLYFRRSSILKVKRNHLLYQWFPQLILKCKTLLEVSSDPCFLLLFDAVRCYCSPAECCSQCNAPSYKNGHQKLSMYHNVHDQNNIIGNAPQQYYHHLECQLNIGFLKHLMSKKFNPKLLFTQTTIRNSLQISDKQATGNFYKIDYFHDIRNDETMTILISIQCF